MCHFACIFWTKFTKWATISFTESTTTMKKLSWLMSKIYWEIATVKTFPSEFCGTSETPLPFSEKAMHQHYLPRSTTLNRLKKWHRGGTRHSGLFWQTCLIVPQCDRQYNSCQWHLTIEHGFLSLSCCESHRIRHMCVSDTVTVS